ncbi:MAG: HlyC/CorC family transporter [Oscillospiraceae bacterium]|nr:HlyC/CorC family transporter [Oscillospiraceae bacterium]
MSIQILLICAAIVLCIVLSNFFSSSEMAYSACNRLRLENAAEEGSRRARTALKIVQNFDNALSAILIGNNLVNIASASLGSILVILLTGRDSYTWVSTLVLTLLVIIFGETIPKITSKKAANRVALRNAYPVRVLMIVLRPVVWLVVGLVNLLTFWIKPRDDDNEEAVEELQSLIETAEDEEVLNEDRSELVQAAIDFSDVSAFEVMTARVDVEAIDIDDSWEEIYSMVEQTSYSRIPVYEDSIDHVIGVLYLNHFLKAVSEGNRDIRSMLMEPCYIYKTMKLPDVMNQLRRARQHLAIVCDEYGGTLGVLSMEDVIEQIVGDIWDETDPVEIEIVRRDENLYELDGSLPIAEFLSLFDLDEDSFEADSDTLGGWTIESFGGRFPVSGESFRYENLQITVLAMDGRRVDRVLVRTDKPVESGRVTINEK